MQMSHPLNPLTHTKVMGSTICWVRVTVSHPSHPRQRESYIELKTRPSAVYGFIECTSGSGCRPAVSNVWDGRGCRPAVYITICGVGRSGRLAVCNQSAW